MDVNLHSDQPADKYLSGSPTAAGAAAGLPHPDGQAEEEAEEEADLARTDRPLHPGGGRGGSGRSPAIIAHPHGPADGSAAGGPAPRPGDFSDDPWERQQPYGRDLALALAPASTPEAPADCPSSPSASSNPCYANVAVAGPGGRSRRPGGGGGGGASPAGPQHPYTPVTGASCPTYRSAQLPAVASSRADQEAGRDPGDSGVVIDFKGGDAPPKHGQQQQQQQEPGQMWL